MTIDRNEVSKMSGPELLALYNGLPGVKLVKRFANRKSALARVLKALDTAAAPEGESTTEQPGEASAAAPPPEAAPVVEAAASKPARKPKAAKGKKPAASDGTGPRPTSKRAQLLTMLQRTEGVTMEAATKKFEWKPQDFKDCVRLLAKKHGIATALGEDGKWRVK